VLAIAAMKTQGRPRARDLYLDKDPRDIALREGKKSQTSNDRPLHLPIAVDGKRDFVEICARLYQVKKIYAMYRMAMWWIEVINPSRASTSSSIVP
jgi:hypothetical protein